MLCSIWCWELASEPASSPRRRERQQQAVAQGCWQTPIEHVQQREWPTQDKVGLLAPHRAHHPLGDNVSPSANGRTPAARRRPP